MFGPQEVDSGSCSPWASMFIPAPPLESARKSKL